MDLGGKQKRNALPHGRATAPEAEPSLTVGLLPRKPSPPHGRATAPEAEPSLTVGLLPRVPTIRFSSIKLQPSPDSRRIVLWFSFAGLRLRLA